MAKKIKTTTVPRPEAALIGTDPAPHFAGNSTERQAVVRPARCPACGSTSHVVARKIVERDLAGEIAGQPYDRVIWRRLRCRQCQQLYTARFYEFSGMAR